MLEAIRATGAPAPAVLAHDQTVLVLERLPGGGQLDQVWPDLGAVLSALHSAVADDLSNRLPAKPTPCLLHGDFWGGNILVSEQRISGLIDPACYYGDREFDFAMLSLFDRPDDRLFEACGTLSAGVAERLPIYQLWPALVHLRLFGSGYRSLVERLLQSLGI